MPKVYLLPAGEYSEHQIIGVFSSREKAEAFKAAYPRRDYEDYHDIEEYELDMGIPALEKGLLYFGIWMFRDGNVRAISTIFDADKSIKFDGTAEVVTGDIVDQAINF
ncbi:MAG: hypothetical protein AAGU05_13995, partial [Anaerolineaceae bacterium]